MFDKNEHPGTFRDFPEERILHIQVNLQADGYAEHGSDHKDELDQAIQQTMLDTGYVSTHDSLSSHLHPEASTYEATILGNGSESYFHALGGACMKMVSMVGTSGASHLGASWRINAPQSMHRPVDFE